MAKLDYSKITAYLGRELTASEHTNLELYSDLAKMRLNDLICDDIDEMCSVPKDLYLVWVRLFGAIEGSNKAMAQSNIKDKRVEDFYISYYEGGFNPTAEVEKHSAPIIAKYSKCVGGIRHGKTLPVNSNTGWIR